MGLSGKMFLKDVRGDASLEIELQTEAAKHDFCPKILKVDYLKTKTRIYMEDVEEESLASTYGDDPANVPEWIWNEIRGMVEVLYEQDGIEYVDITPYNFIEKNDRIYIIDFGDAYYVKGEMNWFLREFLDGENSWNPDYK